MSPVKAHDVPSAFSWLVTAAAVLSSAAGMARRYTFHFHTGTDSKIALPGINNLP